MPAVPVMSFDLGSLALMTPYQGFPTRPTQGFAASPGEAQPPWLVTQSLSAFPLMYGGLYMLGPGLGEIAWNTRSS